MTQMKSLSIKLRVILVVIGLLTLTIPVYGFPFFDND